MHQVHYFGILAPNAKLRKFVVPEPPEYEDADPCGHSVAYEEKRTGPTERRRWIPWRTLLLRVFGVDVMKCPGCGSQMQRIAVIMQPKVIKAILDCLQAKQRPP